MKKLIRVIIKLICKLPIRGRYRIVDKIGRLVAPSYIDYVDINGIKIEIDHQLASNRYVYYGIYEESLVNFLKKHIREDDICFDPGTNIGYISAIESGLVGKNGKVYCFEPSKTCIVKLEKYMYQSKNQNIILSNSAISNKNGESVFVDSPKVISHGWAALKEAYADIDGDSYLVKTYTIDSFCSSNNISRIRFLKLDVEEAEWMAIQGSNEILSQKNIDYVLVETSFIQENFNKNQLLGKKMVEFGYKPYTLSDSGSLTPHKIDYLSNMRLDLIWSSL